MTPFGKYTKSRSNRN